MDLGLGLEMSSQVERRKPDQVQNSNQACQEPELPGKEAIRSIGPWRK